MMVDINPPSRSVPEEGPAELDAGYVLWAGSPGRGAAAGPRLWRWCQRLRHQQRWLCHHHRAAAVRRCTSRWGVLWSTSASHIMWCFQFFPFFFLKYLWIRLHHIALWSRESVHVWCVSSILGLCHTGNTQHQVSRLLQCISSSSVPLLWLRPVLCRNT